MREATRLTAIGKDRGTTVWSAPATGPYSHEVWAPELHHIGNRWYIYFAADDGKNENHRMWVIASSGDDPYGPYGTCTQLATDGWAIDGTVVQNSDSALYFVWSGWPGSVDGLQQLYIAPMSDPMTISGKRLLLAAPTEPWERNAMPICEAPEVLQHNGRMLLIYSASGSWTKHYCLGMLVNDDGDFLSPASWRKVGPVFLGTDAVFGVGHCSFVRSPDSTEDWIIYHAKERPEDGWEDRSTRAQKFTWDSTGLPVFGTPAATGTPLALPSERRR